MQVGSPGVDSTPPQVMRPPQTSFLPSRQSGASKLMAHPGKTQGFGEHSQAACAGPAGLSWAEEVAKSWAPCSPEAAPTSPDNLGQPPLLRGQRVSLWAWKDVPGAELVSDKGGLRPPVPPSRFPWSGWGWVQGSRLQAGQAAALLRYPVNLWGVSPDALPREGDPRLHGHPVSSPQCGGACTPPAHTRPRSRILGVPLNQDPPPLPPRGSRTAAAPDCAGQATAPASFPTSRRKWHNPPESCKPDLRHPEAWRSLSQMCAQKERSHWSPERREGVLKLGGPKAPHRGVSGNLGAPRKNIPGPGQPSRCQGAVGPVCPVAGHRLHL